jgi:hypothetical protein
VQPGREQEPLDPLRHVVQDEPTAGAFGATVAADEHTEAGGVHQLDAAHVDDDVVDAGLDRVREGGADVADAG